MTALVWTAMVLAMLLAWSTPAPGQHRRVRDLTDAAVEFELLTPIEALRKAKQQTRLLVVYSYLPGSPEAAALDAKMWHNPTLALYLRWHAVVIKQPTGTMVYPARIFVIKDCLIRGDVIVTEECDILAILKVRRIGRNTEEQLLPSALTSGKTVRRPLPPIPGPAALLLEMDFALERLSASDPVWHGLHESRNPPPEPPPLPPPLHLTDDGLAEIVEDPPEAQVDVWDRLDAARRAASAGNLHYATGLYTWLWEKGEEADPSFGPARRAFLAAEIADLVRRREPARERFASLRDARAMRLLWAEYDDYHDWCVLSAVVGDDDLILEWFDYFINDEREATMIPGADKAAYDVMLARERFSDPWELGPDPVARISRLAGLKRAHKPARIPHDDWDRLQIFVGQHLLHEACRLHAACLKAGRAADAEGIVSILLQSQDTPEARHAVVTTALVAGVPQAMHARLLDDADARSAPRADLRTKLNEQLRAQE